MPTEQPTPKTARRPDILRDARRVRDILSTYDAERRSALINLALADLTLTQPETP